MKKIIRLTESDLVRIVRKLINEQPDLDLFVRKAHNKIDELEFTEEDYFNYKECRRKKRTFPNYIPTEEEKLAFNKYARQMVKGLDPAAPFKGKGRKEEPFTPEEYFNFKEYKRKKRTSPNYDPTEEERVAYNKYKRQKLKGLDSLVSFRKKENPLTNQTQSVNEDKSIDQILDKIGVGGMGSLSSKERRTLYGSGIKTKDTSDDYPHSLMVIPFYNPQTPLSNQNTGLKLREQHIEKLLLRYNIPSKVSYGFLGLGLGFVYYVNLKLSEHLEDVKTILERKGYTVYSNERSDQGVPPSVEDKIIKYEKSRPDIVFEKKHNFDLTMRQELQRVSKLLSMNKISNYFMDGIGENMIGLTFEINPQERKTPEDLIQVLEKSGYEIIENNYMKNHS